MFRLASGLCSAVDGQEKSSPTIERATKHRNYATK